MYNTNERNENKKNNGNNMYEKKKQIQTEIYVGKVRSVRSVRKYLFRCMNKNSCVFIQTHYL